MDSAAAGSIKSREQLQVTDLIVGVPQEDGGQQCGSLVQSRVIDALAGDGGREEPLR